MVFLLRHLKIRNVSSSTVLYFSALRCRIVRTSSFRVVRTRTRTVVFPGPRTVRKLHELLGFGSRDDRLLHFSSTDHVSVAVLLRHMDDISAVALHRVQKKLPSYMRHQNHLIP